MEASKLIDGSVTVPPAKSGHPSPLRSEAKRVEKRSTGRKAMRVRLKVKAIGKSKWEKLVCRYCGSSDLGPSVRAAPFASTQ
jgi:hypothetical protein